MHIQDLDISLLTLYMRIYGTRTIREFVHDYGRHVRITTDYRVLDRSEFAMVMARVSRCAYRPFEQHIPEWGHGQCFEFYNTAGEMKERLDGGCSVSPRQFELFGLHMAQMRNHIDLEALVSLLELPLHIFESNREVENGVRIGDIVLTLMVHLDVYDYASYSARVATCPFLEHFYAYLSVVSQFMGMTKQWSAVQKTFQNI